jgi:nucleoside-diphosphate-sugar epimerase
MNKSKKILILGGTGFIGSYLSLSCLKKNWDVTVVSKNLPKKKYDKIKYLKCDITKKNSIKKKLNSCNFNYVVNLAGNINHTNRTETYRAHFLGCKNIVNFCLNRNLQKFIQIGSCLEYGKKSVPHDESMKIKITSLRSSYSRAKLASTNYLVSLFKKNNFPCVILRFYQVYGPNQSYERLIPYVIKSCLTNRKFECSNGQQEKDFIYITDAIKAIHKVLKTKKEINGTIINIGMGKPTKIKKIIKLINLNIKKGKPIFGKIPLRKDEQKILYPNTNLAKKIIGWESKTSLLAGLRKTIAFYRKKLII